MQLLPLRALTICRLSYPLLVVAFELERKSVNGLSELFLTRRVRIHLPGAIYSHISLYCHEEGLVNVRRRSRRSCESSLALKYDVVVGRNAVDHARMEGMGFKEFFFSSQFSSVDGGDYYTRTSHWLCNPSFA